MREGPGHPGTECLQDKGKGTGYSCGFRGSWVIVRNTLNLVFISVV